jgi:hypothetical protein
MTSLRRITTVGAGLILLSTSLASCGSDPAPEDPPPAAGTILIGDANSFQSTASLSAVTSVETATSGAAVSVCWNVPEDLLCHTAPAVKTVYLLRLLEPNLDEVRRLLVAGKIQSYVERTLRYSTSADPDGCATLAEFKVGEDPANIDEEYFASAAHSYLLVFSSSDTVGQDTLSLQFISPGAGTTPVQSPNGCGQLTYTVELETLTPVPVPATGPWPVDWRGLTRTGDGSLEPPLNEVNRLLLAYYEGRDVKYLEENIFDLEQIEGAKFWEIPLTNKRQADLSLATDSLGAAFPGFASTGTGTWALALMCDTCSSPAPIMLTILSPTP